jgi:2-isopropylmalate synthase
VDAAYKAIDALIRAPSELIEFSVRSVTEGIDALGEVSVRVRALSERHAQKAQREVASAPVCHGNAADTDIIVASAKAYLKALNRMLASLGQGRASNDRLAAAPAPTGPIEEGRP